MRAVLVLLPTLDERKQERLLLDWAAGHGYVVTSVTAVPAAAAALVEAGLVDVVVLVHHTRATLQMSGRAGLTGSGVDEVRPQRNPLHNHDGTRTRILDAARRGVPAESIALVLDIPVATVHEALGIDAARPVLRTVQPHRRAKVLSRPPGRP
jgi:hypothetical protein